MTLSISLVEEISTTSPSLKVVSVTEFVEMDLRPRSLLLGEWLRDQDIVMVYAKRGVGKTHFGLGVAVAIATGGTFLQWKAPEKRRVIFVDGEMAQQDLQHWVLLELQASGTKAEDADLFLLSTGMQKEGMPNLATEEGQSKLGEILVAGDVLILDNESCLFWETPGDVRDENSGRSIEPLNSWFLRLRHRGVTVILIHHAGKNGSQRGSSRREDLLNTTICLEHPSDYRAEQGARFTISFEKARNLRGGAARSIEAHLHEDDLGNPFWETRNADTSSRDRIINEYLEGNTSPTRISEEIGVSKSYASKVLKKARAEGILE